MRLSMIVGDKTDSPEPHKYDVKLDGVEQRFCIIADEEKNYVRRYKTTRLGIVMAGRNGLLTEDVYGVVTITPKA